jgi:hypothetical protein
MVVISSDSTSSNSDVSILRAIAATTMALHVTGATFLVGYDNTTVQSKAKVRTAVA